MKPLHWCAIATVISPLVLWGGLPYPSASARLVWFSLISVCAASILAVSSLRTATHPTRVTLISGAALFFIVTQLTATIFSVAPFDSFFGSWERSLGVMMLLFALPLFIALQKTWKEAPQKIERAIVVTTALMSLIAIAQAVFPQFLPTFSGGRVGGTLGNAVILGTYLSLSLIAMVAEKKEWRNWLVVTGALLGGIALILTQARASLITTLLVGLALVLTISRRLFIGGVLLLIVLFGAVSWRYTDYVNRFTTTTTIASRATNWLIAWRGFLARPVAGWGPGQYSAVVDKYFDPRLNRFGETESFPDKPHNFYLELAATSGLLGLSGYAALLIAIGTTLVTIYKKNLADRWWVMVVASFFVARELQIAASFETHGSFIPTLVVLAALAERAPPLNIQKKFTIPKIMFPLASFGTAVMIIIIFWFGIILPMQKVRSIMSGRVPSTPPSIPKSFLYETWDTMRETALVYPKQIPSFFDLTQRIATVHKDSALWQYSIGVSAMQLAATTGDQSYYDTAERWLRSADRQTPARLPIVIQRAQLALAQKNFTAAFILATQATQLNNHAATAHWIAASSALFLNDAKSMWPHLHQLILNDYSFKKIPSPLMDAFISSLTVAQMTTEAMMLQRRR